MLDKYKSMCELTELGLPTVKFKGYTYQDIKKKHKELKRHIQDLLNINGVFGVRTESAVEENPGGHFPHGYPLYSVREAFYFIDNARKQFGELFYIVNEGIPTERLKYNAVVFLDEAFGRWKLCGEINYTDTLCLRDAMKNSANLVSVSTLHNEDVGYLRSALLRAGLVDGRIAEVSHFRNPERVIFWEIRNYDAIKKIQTAKLREARREASWSAEFV